MKKLYQITRKLWHNGDYMTHLITKYIFWGNEVVYSSFRTCGIPYINTGKKGGLLMIGDNFAMNNRLVGNNIGCDVPCTFSIREKCKIKIGNNVGMSQTTLVAFEDIIIGNNVKIGGGTCIYTSDFHSLNYKIRQTSDDYTKKKNAPVVIADDVFIGAHCIILKGVVIGRRSIIGAGSVVTKSVPDEEIWAGNPARFVRKIDY